jgi:hypothetical protein
MKYINKFNESKSEYDLSIFSKYNWSLEDGSGDYLDFVYTILEKDLGKDTNGEPLIVKFKVDVGIEYGGIIISIENKNEISNGLFGTLLKSSEPGGYVSGDGLNSEVKDYIINEIFPDLKAIDKFTKNQYGKLKTKNLFKLLNK